MNIVDFAQQILDLAEERDYWAREARFYREMHEQSMDVMHRSNQHTEQMFGTILVAALDPNSGINRATRALARDPLRGAEQ